MFFARQDVLGLLRRALAMRGSAKRFLSGLRLKTVSICLPRYLWKPTSRLAACYLINNSSAVGPKGGSWYLFLQRVLNCPESVCPSVHFYTQAGTEVSRCHRDRCKSLKEPWGALVDITGEVKLGGRCSALFSSLPEIPLWDLRTGGYLFGVGMWSLTVRGSPDSGPKGTG